MVHKRMVDEASRIRAARALTHKIMLYSLFQLDSSKRWKRISDNAYSAKLAGMVFAQRLAEFPLHRSIRLIKIESMEAR